MHFCLSKSSIECLTSSRCSIIVCGREVAIFKEHFSHPHELLLVPPLPSLPSFRSEYVLSKAPRLLSIGGGIFSKITFIPMTSKFLCSHPSRQPSCISIFWLSGNRFWRRQVRGRRHLFKAVWLLFCNVFPGRASLCA